MQSLQPGKLDEESPQPEAKRARTKAPSQAEQLLLKRLDVVSRVRAELCTQSSMLSQSVAAYSLIIDQLIEEATNEVHAAVRSGQDNLTHPEANYELIPPLFAPPAPQASAHYVDAFGQNVSKAGNAKVSCPVCQRDLAASRFAPHLERCLGSSNGRSGGRAGRVKTAMSDDFTA